MAVTVPGRGSGLRLGEARGPVQFGVGDIDVMVASQQPRPAPSAATATGDMHRGRVASTQLALHAVEDFAALLV